jgi:phosphatidylserine/phosphatidylglycerophosphate/cardiolipin synthase-like enzyme
MHVPGSAHQGTKPFYGAYTYTVTPRYFNDHRSLLPLNAALSVSVTVNVERFSKNGLEVGFTRGFTQSQAFVRHFGKDALIRPKAKGLVFDTAVESGVNAEGTHYTYRDEYDWLGFTAREKIFAVLEEVAKAKSVSVDIFAYDLNEPDLVEVILKLARAGQVRIILDNAALHHTGKVKKSSTPSTTGKKPKKKGPTPEDQFETLFNKAAKKGSAILRGKFGRYSHDKVFIVKRGKGPSTAFKVMTGSTNFSVTGMYVNSNHILIYNDKDVAKQYAEVFEESWNDKASGPAFRKSPLSNQTFIFSANKLPRTEITFSPHTKPEVTRVLDVVTSRIDAEGKKAKTTGSVLFAVMEMDKGQSPVYKALQSLHAKNHIFSYGISDNPGGIFLYRPKSTRGVLVTGKPINTILPPPFNQVPSLGGIGHQVHHKFVVCGFGGTNPVVFCGSSNLASGGEYDNGDNLLAIHDDDVVTVFAIEALALVDHFDFLDRSATGPKKKGTPNPDKPQAAINAGWFLSTGDKWVEPYYDSQDLRSVDRQLFA